MKKLFILLILLSNCAFAQQKIKAKEAIPAGGLLNTKIKKTKWYFDTSSIYENKLDLNGNTKQPDVINFIDANKFVVTLEDSTTLSGTYKIFDLQDMGSHNAPPNYKTFKVNKSQNPSQRAKRLTAFLEQDLNVHYDLEEKTMDFVKDEIGPVVPAAIPN